MVALDVVAETLGLHPRTILRAVTGEANPYWTKGYNPGLTHKSVLQAFNCTRKQIDSLLSGEDLLMTPTEACELLRMSKRTLRYRRAEGDLTPLIARGSVVYYTRQHLLEKELNKTTI
jgi:hypothetical protein